MKKRVVFGTIFGAVIVGVFFFFTIFSGITELSAQTADPNTAKRGDVIEYRIIYANKVLELKHMLFGIIPTYSEQFYVTMSEDGLNHLAVRADEQWFSDNFTPDGVAKQPIRMNVMIKSASSKNGLDLSRINAKIGDMGHVDNSQYADASYVAEATLKIFSGILLLTAVLTIVMMLILLSIGVIKKGGAGVNIMMIFAILQMAAFIIILFAI